jgi:hypothetical protein
MCFYGYRYYSPERGRWLSPDPIGHLDDANVYQCGKNHIVNVVDVLGLYITSSQLNQLGGTPGFSPSDFNAGYHNPGVGNTGPATSCGYTSGQLCRLAGSVAGGLSVGGAANSAAIQQHLDYYAQQISDTSDDCCLDGTRVGKVAAWTLHYPSAEACAKGDLSQNLLPGLVDESIVGGSAAYIAFLIGASNPVGFGIGLVAGGLANAMDFNPVNDFFDAERAADCNKFVCPAGSASMIR